MSELLAGRYELGDRLGLGGMSTVRIAFDRRLEREVALKLLAEHLADDPAFVTRFRREALAAARLVHPNIVQVFDFGFDDAGHRHYIVMEVVHGRSGAELLREHGQLSVGDTVALVEQACRGLAYAHDKGVVHRDVKPGNLLRGHDGVVKLADFGIAKALSEESSITQVGSVLGTAAYLAPEQAAGQEVGPAADIYAMGVVTYQFVAGRLPYPAQSLTELALKQQSERPPRLDDLDPAVPSALAAAVDRAIALDPRDRPPDVEALRRALVDGARGVGPTTGATRRVAPPTALTRTADPSTSEHPLPARRPRTPRDMPAAPAPARAAAPAARARRRRRPLRRFLQLLFLLVVLAAAGGAWIVYDQAQQRVRQLPEITGETVRDTVDELRRLIEENTR